MARRPYFTGDYGSALARVDTRPIIEAGRAQGQMYAQMGQNIGGMIKEYGLNKVKRAKLTGEIEAHYKDNPEALSQIGMSGDEAQDKKDYTEREKFIKGDMNIAQLEGLAGKLARGGVLQTKKANMDLLRAQIKAQEEHTRVSMDNRQIKETSARYEDAFWTGLQTQRDEVVERLKEHPNMKLEPWARRLIAGELPITTRQGNPEDWRTKPTEDDLTKAEIEQSNLLIKKYKGDITVQEQKIEAQKIALEEAKAEPTFASMEKVKEWELTLPPGVKAVVEKHKTGWRATSLTVTSKDRVEDIPSVTGYPNYKIIGGYVYEGDPDKKTLTKLGAEQPGRETELLIKVIGAMSTPDVEQYRKAKLRGTPSDDGKFFEFEDPISGVEYRIPFNKDLEEKIAEIKKFEDQMKSSMPNTVDFRTR